MHIYTYVLFIFLAVKPHAVQKKTYLWPFHKRYLQLLPKSKKMLLISYPYNVGIFEFQTSLYQIDISVCNSVAIIQWSDIKNEDL